MITNVKELLNAEIAAAWETTASFYVFPENGHEFDETMYKVDKYSGKVEELGYLDFALSAKATSQKIDPSVFKRAFS